jgi:2',3'-cyclic-nucleotide 2'-phosphodiesterase (5'-nucleotidase family)
LGNHEFDNGITGLVPFLNNVSFPVLAANLDLSAEPALEKTKQLKKSTILLAKNKKIGVVGYVTPDTKVLSRPENVVFLDEVEAVKKESKYLKSQGCDIIIALGHSGYEADMKIGREVEEVDLVIGGHTNTFLYNGHEPDLEKPEGLYPTVVVQPSGKKVYVVQAYAYTKYLGDLRIDFNRFGDIVRIEGNPILVDSSIPMAQDVVEELKVWTEPLVNITTKVVGTTNVLLEGDDKVCRLKECNFGNFLTDALIFHVREVLLTFSFNLYITGERSC